MTFQLTLDADAIPKDVAKDLYVSVRVGEAQKLSKFCPSRTFRFPRSAIGDRRVGKVELFKRIAGHSIEIHAGAKHHLQEVPFEHIEPGLKFQVSLDGPPPPDPEVAAKLAKPKAAAAKEYMERHGLELRLSEAMQSVLRELPDDPIMALCNALQQTKGAVKKVPLPEPWAKAQGAEDIDEPPLKQEEDAQVEEQAEAQTKDSAAGATQASEVVASPPAARQENVAEPPAEPPALWPESEGTAPAGQLSSSPAETAEGQAPAEHISTAPVSTGDVADAKPQEEAIPKETKTDSAPADEPAKADSSSAAVAEQVMEEPAVQASGTEEPVNEGQANTQGDAPEVAPQVVEAELPPREDAEQPPAQASPHETAAERQGESKSEGPEVVREEAEQPSAPAAVVEEPPAPAAAVEEPQEEAEEDSRPQAAAPLPPAEEEAEAPVAEEPPAQAVQVTDEKDPGRRQVEMARLAAREAVRASLEKACASQATSQQGSASVELDKAIEPTAAPDSAPPAPPPPVAEEQGPPKQVEETASAPVIDDQANAETKAEPSPAAAEEEVAPPAAEEKSAAPATEEKSVAPATVEKAASTAEEKTGPGLPIEEEPMSLEAVQGAVRDSLVEAHRAGSLQKALSAASAAFKPATSAPPAADKEVAAAKAAQPPEDAAQPRQTRPVQVFPVSVLYGASLYRMGVGNRVVML